jgi:HPt (histidine-containing phosphotransfer) domain-containing protein
MNKEEIKRRLDTMHADYRAKVPEKVAEIEALWTRIKEARPGDPSATPVRRELQLAAHTLVGSAPTLGCEALGAAARDLESALNAAFAGASPLEAAQKGEIDRLVGRLAGALA